ncbi:MAG: 16S rRNA (adenine(1518)-N(6)/adenine(1519)-N(6))-dimethyltransferase RsmA [Oscillospiraceae bacterium]|nr:16S rRNA (adenine(1518)-N(6)/adenine(1519)-N(6))-dimethyltransferase RsmA [Oscillospiraceae bacterium]
MNLFSIKDITALLTRHGFNFSKSLGQNFLTEAFVCEDIVNLSGISDSDCVLEIGPGIGSLTTKIAPAAKKVVSVEIDKKLIPVLGETLADFDNVTVINEDIMKCNLKELIDKHFDGISPKVCANLPYYITSPIISFLLESRLFSSVTIMIQKEVADRICAKAGTAAYGAFTVFVQYYSDPEFLFKVSADCFIPKPKVESAVIRLNTRETPPISPKSENLFFRVVRASFAQRRKQLVNGLFSEFKSVISKEEIINILTSLGHKPTVRGEELTIQDFSDISDALFSFCN